MASIILPSLWVNYSNLSTLHGALVNQEGNGLWHDDSDEENMPYTYETYNKNGQWHMRENMLTSSKYGSLCNPIYIPWYLNIIASRWGKVSFDLIDELVSPDTNHNPNPSWSGSVTLHGNTRGKLTSDWCATKFQRNHPRLGIMELSSYLKYLICF